MIAVGETVRCHEPVGRHANISRATFSTSFLEERLVDWQNRQDWEQRISRIINEAIDNKFETVAIQREEKLQDMLDEHKRDAIIADVVIRSAESVFVACLIDEHLRAGGLGGLADLLQVIEYRRSIEPMIGDVITILYQVTPEQTRSADMPPEGLLKEVGILKQLGVKPPPPKPPKEILKIPNPPPRRALDDLFGTGDDDE